jgi:hypothetical protein
MMVTQDRSTTTTLVSAIETRVRLRAQRFTAWLRNVWAADAGDPGQGLAITHAEVDHALTGRQVRSLAEAAYYAEDDSTEELRRLIEEADGAVALNVAWRRLQDEFALSQPEADMLALLLAGESDPSLLRVYGYLQDDAHACHATPWLAARLWPAGVSIGPDSALVRWRLARPAEPAGNPWSATSPWTLDPAVLSWVQGGSGLDPALGAAVRLIKRDEGAALDCLYPALLTEVRDYIESLRAGGETPRIELELIGAEASGRRTLASQLCASLDIGLVVADAAALLGPDVPPGVAVENGLRVARSARLAGAAGYWHRADSVNPTLWPSLPAQPLSIFGSAATLAIRSEGAAHRAFRLPELTRRERRDLWERLTGAAAPAAVAEWKLTAGEIAAAAQSAAAGPEAVVEACRTMLYQSPGELFTPLACPYTWDDIVLTPNLRQHLEEIEAQARLRGAVFEEWGFEKLFPLGRGLTALFAGPSGTGKTMAAQVMARSLGLELYRVDLSGVMNKYIGETEKRLKQVFDACERANVLLFFDEADALFGQRTQVKDAHDRFANIEIDYLLQRMEQFEGLAILATNRKNDIDKAFLRRLRFIVDFVEPGQAERKRLWQLALLSHSPAGDELLNAIDWDLLAEKLAFTGAEIKSTALAAAFLARNAGCRIGMTQVLAAARRELTKQGTVLRAGEWEL